MKLLSQQRMPGQRRANGDTTWQRRIDVGPLFDAGQGTHKCKAL